MLNNKYFNKIISFVICLIMTFSLGINAKAANAYWRRDGRGWWLEYESGGYPYNTWLKVGGYWYCFNGSGYVIQNSWVQSGGSWYYLGSSGAMAVSTWVQSSGKWYYVGSDGAMYVNSRTPDGYYVGSDGAWSSGGSGNSGGSGSNVSTSNTHVLRAVEFGNDLSVGFSSYKSPINLYATSLNATTRLDSMLWVAHAYKDSRLSESGEYFVMNVNDAKEMIRQIFGSVTSQDVSAMSISGTNMYYNSVAFRGDAGPHRFKSPNSANLEGSQVRIVGDITDYENYYIGTYTIILSKTDGGYFGGYSFQSLSTSYN